MPGSQPIQLSLGYGDYCTTISATAIDKYIFAIN